MEIVQSIMDASNEYAEQSKDNHPVMFQYYIRMTSEDFYLLVGVFVHMGYRKIPCYQLIWKHTSHCYDPLISIVFSRHV